MRTYPTVATVATPFKLEMVVCGYRSYVVKFYRECDVIDFIRRYERKNEAQRDAGQFGGGYAWFALEDSPVPDQWDALYHLLFPTCDHGLSEDLCWGPNHYPTADEERAMGW